MAKLINKLFFSLVFIISIALTAMSASALVITYADWNADLVTDTTITQGNSTQYRVAVESFDAPVSYSIRMYDSSENLISTIADTSDSDGSYQAVLNLSNTDYNNTAGLYTLRVIASDGAGDFDSSELTLNVTPLRPDLIISSASVTPSQLIRNQSFVVNLNLTNMGLANITNDDFLVEIIISDSSFTGGSIPQSIEFNNISSNQTISVQSTNINFSEIDVYNNTLYLIINADGDGDITESNETNNAVFLTLNVTNATAPQNLTINTLSPSDGVQINNTQTAQFTFNITANTATANCSIYLDNSLNQTNSSVLNNTNTIFTLNNISYGPHSWNLSCTNTNSTATSNARNFTIADTIAPTLNISSPIAQSYNTTNILINLTVSDAVGISQVWVSNGTTNTTLASPYNITQTFADNSSHTVFMYVNDTSGNINTKNVTFSVNTSAPTADIFAPSLSIVSPTSTNYTGSLILVNISASDPNLDDIWYRLNNGTNTTYTTPITVNLTDGSYTLFAYANDTLGNLNSTNVSFLVNTTGIFSGSIKDLSNNLIPNSNVSITATNYFNFTTTGNYVINGVPPGVYTMIATANGYLNQSVTNQVLTNGTTKTVNFNLAQAGNLVGNVYNFTSNSGVNNATLTLIQSGSSVGTTNTNATGYYTFINIAPGYYDVNVTANGFTSNSKPNSQVIGGQNTTVNFWLWS